MCSTCIHDVIYVSFQGRNITADQFAGIRDSIKGLAWDLGGDPAAAPSITNGPPRSTITGGNIAISIIEVGATHLRKVSEIVVIMEKLEKAGHALYKELSENPGLSASGSMLLNHLEDRLERMATQKRELLRMLNFKKNINGSRLTVAVLDNQMRIAQKDVLMLEECTCQIKGWQRAGF